MLSLKICEIAVKDAGKGFARLDPKDMRALGVSPWDLIEIDGKRRTVVRVMQIENSATLRVLSVRQVWLLWSCSWQVSHALHKMVLVNQAAQ